MIATSYQLIAISGSAVVTSLAPPSDGLTVERQLQTNSSSLQLPTAAPCIQAPLDLQHNAQPAADAVTAPVLTAVQRAALYT